MGLSETERAVEAWFEDLLALTSDLDVDSLQDRVLRAVAPHAGARAGAFSVVDGTGERVHPRSLGLPQEAADAVLDRYAGTREPDRFDDGALGPVLVVPVSAADGSRLGLLVLSDPVGDGFGCDDVQAASRLAVVLGVALANARAFTRSERRRRWVEATARVTEALHPPFRLVEPVNRIVAGAADVVGSGLVAVVRCGEHGYDVAAAVSPHARALPTLLEEVAPAIREAQESGALFEQPYGAQGTVAGVPLNPELAFEGVVLVVLDRGRGTLPAEDRELLSSFVTHGSLVLDRAILLQERQEAVVAADRDRIARDLHDLVVQRLFATGLKLQATRHTPDQDTTRERVDEAVRELDVTIRDIRSTIFELEHGLDSSVRAGVSGLVREYQPLLGFLPTLRTWGPLNSLVGRPLAEQVMAVLREALANCARHAGASSCVVELEVSEGWLALRVTDDGCGLPEDLHESGLRNLRRRAEELGGWLEVASVAPHGTRFAWSVPAGDA